MGEDANMKGRTPPPPPPSSTAAAKTSSDNLDKDAPSLHFMLVHGIGGGAWCWYKIRSLLEAAGHRVSCVDLASAGIDPTDADAVLSFDDYNAPLMQLMSSLPDTEKVILVGQSAGGLSLTQASGRFPRKISMAVYVAATMLKLGFHSDQDLKDGVPDLSEYGNVYDLGFGMGHDKPPTSAVIKKEFQRKILYDMSPREDSTLAAMLLKPGPLLALMTAKFEDAEDIETVPRVYIRTKQDRVVKPEQQEAMIKRWTPKEVFELDSDHSPFFSAPSSLFDLLVKAAASWA